MVNSNSLSSSRSSSWVDRLGKWRWIAGPWRMSPFPSSRRWFLFWVGPEPVTLGSGGLLCPLLPTKARNHRAVGLGFIVLFRSSRSLRFRSKINTNPTTILPWFSRGMVWSIVKIRRPPSISHTLRRFPVRIRLCRRWLAILIASNPHRRRLFRLRICLRFRRWEGRRCLLRPWKGSAVRRTIPAPASAVGPLAGAIVRREGVYFFLSFLYIKWYYLNLLAFCNYALSFEFIMLLNDAERWNWRGWLEFRQ